ncbi:MAG: DUF3309 domain-containing protein [Nitrospira sp.]|nr:DUF3309 domain-containing protein [Nitrospira sp.]
MGTAILVVVGLSLLTTLPKWSASSRWVSYLPGGMGLVLLFLTWTGDGLAQSGKTGTFDERDTRVFKAVACTKDKKPVEALYYIAASRSDLSEGKPSPSSQLMKDEVGNNWQEISSQLTMEQVIEERYADTYHTLLTKMIPLLQQAVQDKSGVAIAVTEVNSRPMDQGKDQDVPVCSVQ